MSLEEIIKKEWGLTRKELGYPHLKLKIIEPVYFPEEGNIRVPFWLDIKGDYLLNVEKVSDKKGVLVKIYEDQHLVKKGWLKDDKSLFHGRVNVHIDDIEHVENIEEICDNVRLKIVYSKAPIVAQISFPSGLVEDEVYTVTIDPDKLDMPGISAEEDKKLKDDSMIYRILFRHEIDHYNICPHSTGIQFAMLASVIKALKKKERKRFWRWLWKLKRDKSGCGFMVVNIFSDPIIDIRGARNCPEVFKIDGEPGMEWLIKNKFLIKYKEILKKGNLIRRWLTKRRAKTNVFYMLMLGELYGFEPELKASNKMKEDAKKAASVIESCLYNPQLWFDGIYAFAKILEPYLPKGGKGSGDMPIRQKSKDTTIKPENISIKGYKDILKLLNIKKSEIEYLIEWYKSNVAKKLKFKPPLISRGKYPAEIKRWELSDSIENLDTILTTQSYGRISGRKLGLGMAKKWQDGESKTQGSLLNPDYCLLLVLDSSKSMKGHYKEKNSTYHATLTAFELLEIIDPKIWVSSINFSSNEIVQDWTLNRRKIYENLVLYQGHMTHFPVDTIIEQVEKAPRNCITLLISDSELQFPKKHFYSFSVDKKKIAAELKSLDRNYFITIAIGKDVGKKRSMGALKILSELGDIYFIEDIEKLDSLTISAIKKASSKL